MKAIGIVRKIDDLGRIVIPKEFRKTQGWVNGQPLEMFIDGDKLVMQTYRKDVEKKDLIESLQTWKSSDDLEKIIGRTIEYLEK